jgi:hypothetical protein
MHLPEHLALGSDRKRTASCLGAAVGMLAENSSSIAEGQLGEQLLKTLSPEVCM